MKKKRRKHPLTNSKANVTTHPDVAALEPVGIRKLLPNARNYEAWILGLLVVVGLYQAVIFWEHQAVPNSDFPAFARAAQPLLHFELPSSFKRVPTLGLLQIGLSQFCWGSYPDLTAGWLLNAIFHVANIVLFYRVGKHLLGTNSFFFALLASVNPRLLESLCEPIAETTLVFFTLLTFDFLFRRSWWAYLIAVAASMTRYECAALILIVFAVDILLRKEKREKIRAAVFAAVSLLPMGLWLIGAQMGDKLSSGHYVGHFVHDRPRVGLSYWNLLWKTTFDTLLQSSAWVGASFGKIKVTSAQQRDALLQGVLNLGVVVRIVTGAGFIFALIAGAVKKCWKFWALVAFWIGFVGLHSARHATLPRYTVPVMWLTLLIVFYGFQSLGKFFCQKVKLPGKLIVGGHLVLWVIAGIGLVKLSPVLPRTVAVSRDSASLVYAAIGAIVIYLLIQWRAVQKVILFRSVTLLVVGGLFLVSNQFQVARVLGNGDRDAEFKALAAWYVENAHPDEKLMTTLPGVVRLFLSADRKRDVIFTGGGSASTVPQFIQDCYKRNIAYVAWDSRLGLVPKDSYYKKWNLQKTAPLVQPKDVGPFEFVKRIDHTPRRYIHIFKLKPLSSLPPTIQQQLTDGQPQKQP